MNERSRLFKKIFIAVIYLAVFAGLGTGAYFLFRPTPVLPPPPAPTIYPIEILWSQAFTSGPDFYSVAAKIQNPNANFGADDFDYSFYLYNENGARIGTLNGKSFIWPGESKYIVDGGINLLKAPIKVVFETENPDWHEISNFKGINLTLGNVSYGRGKSDFGKFFTVDFMANNNTPFDLKNVYVSAVVLNKEKLPIAVGSTILKNINSKERRFFSIPWFSQFLGTPVSVDLSISTNLWETPELLGQ